jgi:hypothetical protein
MGIPKVASLPHWCLQIVENTSCALQVFVRVHLPLHLPLELVAVATSTCSCIGMSSLTIPPILGIFIVCDDVIESR